MKFYRSWVAGIGVVAAACSLVACSSDEKGDGKGNVDGSGGKGGDAGPVKPQSSVDWTRMGYDMANTYNNTAETKISAATVANLTKAWELDTTGTPVTGTPVIAGGRVYVLGNFLYALNLADGSEIWKKEYAGTSSPALDDGVLYFHDGGGTVRAVNAEDGTEIWSQRPDESPNALGYSSAQVTDKYVIVGGSGLDEVVLPAGQAATFKGFVAALNKSDGTIAWKKFTVEDPYNGVAVWSTVSADLDDNLVIASTGNNYTGQAGDTSDSFLALAHDQGDGDFLWKQQIFAGDLWTQNNPGGGPDNDFGANPILFELNGKKLAAAGNKGGDVWVVDRTDGTVIQKRSMGPVSFGTSFKGGVFISGAWSGKTLLFAVNGASSTEPGSETVGGGVLFGLDPETLDVNWERQYAGTAFGPISVANGVGFFGKGSILQAFDTETGEKLYEFQTTGVGDLLPGTIASAPAISDGNVCFGSGMNWIGSTAGTKYYCLTLP
jgi:outer membrane protein assembly factor BamB